MGKQKSCELCGGPVFNNPLGQTRKRILCDNCFSKVKQTIIYWYLEMKFGREAISKKILELFRIFFSGKLIENLLVSWGYEKRQRFEALRLRHQTNPGTIKTGYSQRSIAKHQKLIAPIEKKFGKPYEEIIDVMYWDDEKSYSDIGRELGIPETTIKNWNNRKRRQRGRTVQNAMALPRYREKQRIIAIRRRLESNQIGSITSAFLSDPLKQFRVLADKEVFSILLSQDFSQRDSEELKRYFLIYLAQLGRMDSRNIMVENNLPLISVIAKKYNLYKYLHDGLIDFEDVNQEGVFGLINAVYGFDFSKGTTFGAYADYWIRQSVQRFFQNHARTIRLPVYIYELIANYVKSGLSNEESIKRVAEKLGIEPVAFDSILSLDWQYGGDEENTHTSLIATQKDFSPKLIEQIDNEKLWIIIRSSLTKKELHILELRFSDKMSLREIGKEFSKSFEWVRLQIKDIFKKLKQCEQLMIFLRGYISEDIKIN